MTCPLCLRDVPQLVGPERICIDCYALLEDDTAGEFREEPFAGLYDESVSGSAVPDYVEELIPGLVFGGVGPQLEEEDDEGRSSAVPTFGGRPRF